MNAHTESRMPALMTGGNVGAIIPRSVEEIWRVSKMVVEAGLAPSALVDKKAGNDAISSVCVAIMSGAELGLPPMVALRSFTVINGKPALYGDGLINVCRRSGRAEYIRTGYDKSAGIGWCEAKRNDTGEEKRVEFSLDDARHAGLYEDKPIIKRKNFKTGEWYEKPNDAPWYRYPQRMAPWRAAGYCLRDLFADVLGGMPTEDEAREIAGEPEMRDITPAAPPSPPSPPSPTKTSEPVEDAQTVEDAHEDSGFVLGDFLEALGEAIELQSDEAGVEELWNEFDPEATLSSEGHEDMIPVAFKVKKKRLAQLSPMNGG